jgi:hypothetical protein
VGGVAGALVSTVVNYEAWLHGFIDANLPGREDQVMGLIAAVTGAATAAAAWIHWKRFMVPITVAAGAVAVVGVAIALILAVIPAAKDAIFPLGLVAGLAMFAVAMAWDVSDLERRTRRADVAFWLHLAAAPMIAHSVFQMLGVFGPAVSVGTAAVVLALYVVFAFVALAVDRRALLVSSLAYVLYAMYALFTQAGAVELSAALTALVIGSALLLLSAFWQPMRRKVVSLLGDFRHRLPPVQMPVAT